MVISDIFGCYDQTVQGADILATGDDHHKYKVFIPDWFDGEPFPKNLYVSPIGQPDPGRAAYDDLLTPSGKLPAGHAREAGEARRLLQEVLAPQRRLAAP